MPSFLQARFGSIIGDCALMHDIYRKVSKAAAFRAPILVTGEHGTGKELVAREVHQRSNHHKGPFVTVNCGSIPENLMESELFGHVRGAFTGALFTRGGKFQSAHQGTLFIDEIADIPLSVQAKLLTAISDKAVIKVGDTRTEAVDVRLIVATTRNLALVVRSGLFREDLYYALTTFPMNLPPLRDRGNDVILIANFLLQKQAHLAKKHFIGLTESAQNALINYSWSGNIRELENVVSRAAMLAQGDRIDVGDLSINAATDEAIVPLSEAVERFRHAYIHNSLERNAGNRTRAAKELGIDPRTIFRHLEQQKRAETPAT